MTATGGMRPDERGFLLRATAIVVFALALRLLYVGMAQTDYPIRGDINQYVLYAWNLTHRGTFSTALPDAAMALPDSYRGPGYPVLLAACMRLAGQSDLPLRPAEGGLQALGYRSDTWMTLALGAQAALGAATVWLVIALARLWLPRGWALAAGAMTAFWPHLITFTGVLLSETLFAFLLVFSLWLLCRAVAAGASSRPAAVAGLGWGVTSLVNPVAMLFPLLATAFVARTSRRQALVFLAAFAILPAAWALRNALVVTGPGALKRMEQNFVEGSWPQYHQAFNSRFDNAISGRIVAAIDRESEQLAASPREGLAAIAERMSVDPWFYLRWYAVEKPYLLWDWSVRIGAGDIYYLPAQHSPFERIPLLAWVKMLCRWLNPLLFALAAAAAFAALLAALRRRTVPVPLLLLSLLTIYLTAVHSALQAEPRYSVPYRPEEIVLAVTALAWIAAVLGQRLGRTRHGEHA